MAISQKKFVIRIAGIILRADSDVPIDRFNDIGFYKDFVVESPGRCHCRLNVNIKLPPNTFVTDQAFSPRGNWKLSAMGNKRVLEIGPPVKRGPPDNLSIFNYDYTKGDVYHASPTEIFRGFLDQFLIINLLSRNNGFLLHSSGVAIHGDGLCFIGRSGAGKSTLLRLFRDEVETECLLNDDKLALRKARGRWHVFGTPWHGEFPVASQKGARLKALFFIKQSKHNYLTKLSASDALSRLVSQALIPLWDKEASARVVDSFNSLIKDMPSFEFGFLPDKSAVEFLKKAL